MVLEVLCGIQSSEWWPRWWRRPERPVTPVTRACHLKNKDMQVRPDPSSGVGRERARDAASTSSCRFPNTRQPEEGRRPRFNSEPGSHGSQRGRRWALGAETPGAKQSIILDLLLVPWPGLLTSTDATEGPGRVCCPAQADPTRRS